jgi:hypothetical protein
MSSRLIQGWKRIRWVLGRWSHQMNFRRSSSRKVEMEIPFGGVTRKARVKDPG